MAGFSYPNIGVVLPVDPFNGLVDSFGMRFNWMKAHSCPCVYGTTLAGQADPQCTNCGGYGTYWDQPLGPFNALITFRHLSQSPDEPGVQMNPQFGQINQSSPMITVATTALNGVVWNEASLNDGFVEIDSVVRYETVLVVGGIQSLPYQQNGISLLVQPTGAVKTYDPATHSVTSVSGYTVTNGTITLPAQYPKGTSYTVEFHANPIYFIFRKAGGMPHVRPPGGAAAEKLPRGYHLQPLDIWTRARTSKSFSPQSF